MNQKNLNKLINQSIQIDEEPSIQEGMLGYACRALIQGTLPHKKVEGFVFDRINGNFRMSIFTNVKDGLPYGSIPRLILAWITTEATKKKEKHILLGTSLASFIKQVGLVPKGGRLGTNERFKYQFKRFSSCPISCTYDNGKSWAIQHITPIKRAEVIWDEETYKTRPKESYILLDDDFFNEITERPVPIDLRILHCLSKSSLAIDIYQWITYRVCYLNKPCKILWKTLQFQFGSDYPNNNRGKLDFKREFIEELKKVNIFYELNVEILDNYLVLRPSKTNIIKLSNRI